jgi:hypothetical protein
MQVHLKIDIKGLLDPERVLFSDEACFTPIGFLSCQTRKSKLPEITVKF